MRTFTPILVVLIVLCRASFSSCYSDRVPELLSTPVDELIDYNGDQIGSNVKYRGSFRIARSNRALRYADMLATGSVLLAILFLLVRCAAYIESVSGFFKAADRRLSASGACGGEVGYSHLANMQRHSCKQQSVQASSTFIAWSRVGVRR